MGPAALQKLPVVPHSLELKVSVGGMRRGRVRMRRRRLAVEGGHAVQQLPKAGVQQLATSYKRVLRTDPRRLWYRHRMLKQVGVR